MAENLKFQYENKSGKHFSFKIYINSRFILFHMKGPILPTY